MTPEQKAARERLLRYVDDGYTSFAGEYNERGDIATILVALDEAEARVAEMEAERCVLKCNVSCREVGIEAQRKQREAEARVAVLAAECRASETRGIRMGASMARDMLSNLLSPAYVGQPTFIERVVSALTPQAAK